MGGLTPKKVVPHTPAETGEACGLLDTFVGSTLVLCDLNLLVWYPISLFILFFPFLVLVCNELAIMLSSEGAVKGLTLGSSPFPSTLPSISYGAGLEEIYFFNSRDNSEKRPATGGLTPKKVVPRMPAEWMTSADDVELVIITIREGKKNIRAYYYCTPPCDRS
jgi:hypothetical protein